MKSLGIVALVVVALSTGSAFADTINIRPAFGTGTTLNDLQSTLDTFAGGDIGFDVKNDQLAAALFEPTGGPPASGVV